MEFALVATVLVPMLIAVVEIGLVMWAKGAVQTAAALSARCAALATQGCDNPAAYAVSVAEAWSYPGVITQDDVSPAPHTVCIGAVPTMMVTIKYRFWAVGTAGWATAAAMTTSVAYFPIPGPSCG